MVGLVAYVVRLRTAATRLRRNRDEAIERHVHVLQAVADGVYVVDEDLRIGHLNPEAERLLPRLA